MVIIEEGGKKAIRNEKIKDRQSKSKGNSFVPLCPERISDGNILVLLIRFISLNKGSKHEYELTSRINLMIFLIDNIIDIGH